MQEKKPDNAVILAAGFSSRFVPVCPVRYKVGITVGVFDLFHVGHLNLLERCKTMCDHLIVAIKCVDEVIPVSIEETEDKMLLIKNHPFDVLFSGDDWKGTPRYLKTEEEFAKYGAKIEYLSYTMGVSTRELRLSSTLIHHCRLMLAA